MAKRKKINFELIDRMVNSEPYSIMDELLVHHPDLRGASIAIAWRINFKADKDNHLVLGKCMKASDLQRELVAYDFVILLNSEMWEVFSRTQKYALLDHELCHATVSTDEEGDPIKDERGRQVWRIRKHDIEEFQEIIERHGCYKRDLERFAKAIIEKRDAPLFSPSDDKRKISQEIQ